MKLGFFSAIALIACSASADEPVAIPLNEIWAWQMPGTHALTADRDAQDQFLTPEGILVEEIVRCLPLARSGLIMRQGFAVTGNGTEALKGAYATLVEKQRPTPQYQTDSDVSIVYFTDLSAYRAQVREVTRNGEHIDVSYELVPHKTNELTANFAIVPLGKLPNGRYRVRMNLLPVEKSEQIILETIARRIVCQPFSFVVKTITPDRTIPIGEIWGYHIPGTKELASDGRDVMGNPKLPDLPGDDVPRLVEDIRTAIQKLPRPRENEQPKQAFFVPGSGIDALREARNVLVGDKKQRRAYSVGEEVSLVFFTYQFQGSIELVDVKYQGEGIPVRYRFVPRKETYVSEYFAIIPIGKLDRGKIAIRMFQMPMEPKYARASFQQIGDSAASRIICGSFIAPVLDHEIRK